jgi:high affinity Mn2+ porin
MSVFALRLAAITALAAASAFLVDAARADEAAQDPDAVAQLAQPSDTPASSETPSQTWALHYQSTFVEQFHPAFRSPYRGENSLSPAASGAETFDATLFAGVSLWKGMELWVNPEIDQGMGLSNTVGIAGFPSGEAYKEGSVTPYFRLQRLFVRQTIDLGGERQAVDPDANQLGGSHTANRIVITAGVFSVPDIFDANSYAHDARNDFLNWSIIDTGSFDYAANAWGYTPGVAVEWYQGPWVLRAGFMDMSSVPNGPDFDANFGQHQFIAELERDWSLKGRSGKIRLTGFDSYARFGAYSAAIALAQKTGEPADIYAVGRYTNRPGASISFEQQLSANIGAFVRAGWSDGQLNSFEFTDIDRSVAAGLSLSGAMWGRKDDAVGVAGVVNELSNEGYQFLNAGGMGIVVGDGKLPYPSAEKDFETYYKLPLAKHLSVTVDYQLSVDPGYNSQRGPVSIFGLRLHLQD